MTRRDVDREIVEATAMRMAAAVMQHDLTLDQFWKMLHPVAAKSLDSAKPSTS